MNIIAPTRPAAQLPITQDAAEEAQRAAADLAYNELKNSGELRRLDDARAMALQLQWGDE